MRIPRLLASEMHLVGASANEMKLLLCALDAAVDKAEYVAAEPTLGPMRVEISIAEIKASLKRHGPSHLHPIFEGVATRMLMLAGREERIGISCDAQTVFATLPPTCSYLVQDAALNESLIEFDSERVMALKSKHSLHALLRLSAWKEPKIRAPEGITVSRRPRRLGIEMSISNFIDYMGSRALQDSALARSMMRTIKADLASFGINLTCRFDREPAPRRVHINLLPPAPPLKRFGGTTVDNKSSTRREKAVYDPDLSQVLRDIAAGQITHDKAMQLLILR